MIRVSWKIGTVLTALVVACLLTGKSIAQSDTNEPEPAKKEEPVVHERRWLLDEIRTVSEALSRARTGHVAINSQSAVPAGFGTLPLPKVTTPIRTDGKLDERGWQNATSLPVGPIFADWLQGPFMIQVSTCRDETTFYLAIRSPHDLSQLRAAFGSAALFEIADQPYRVDEPAGNIKGGIVRKDSAGQTIELALPLPAEPIQLTFYAELVRRRAGPATQEERTERNRAAGHQHAIRGRDNLDTETTRLDPISIKLIPAPDAIRFKDATSEPNQVRLSYTLRARDMRPKTRTVKLQETGESGVYRYRYALKIRENSYEIESLLYVEPVTEMLDAVRQILSRSANQGLSEEEQNVISEAAEKLEQELDDVESYGRKQWRRLYCEARRLKARARRKLPKAH